MEVHEQEPVTAPEVELSDYEIERGKPMPNRIHGTIQLKLGALFYAQYAAQFQFVSELSLATTPPTTPDLCVYRTRPRPHQSGPMAQAGVAA